MNEEDEFSEVEIDTRKLVSNQNKKRKKSGGFQAMGLSKAIFNGVMKKGYNIPTPIQRKCIPLVMDGKDVVAMARTGSGKTAAFLVPMFEKLQARKAQSGARALILSPTRELALQTLKFTKELGRYTNLKAVAILGGHKMEDQFAAVHENPDILIATPGRFLHVMVEMNLKLTSVEYVVFDEADRLFEMGFQDQLHEIIKRLSDTRQTLLFSATLPKMLVDFARLGLRDPVLIRLDVDEKLSENLKTAFLSVRMEDKTAVLLHLLQNLIKPQEMTVVFLATKFHVEYLSTVLELAGISCTYIYSSLDQAARKINIAKFLKKKVRVLLVTDVASRGIDIPLLDNVVNYNFPAKPKLFVHRVGRVARAGCSGNAYSLVSSDEMPFMLDLHLFLGRPLKHSGDGDGTHWDGHYGLVPPKILEDEEDKLVLWHKECTDLPNMKRMCDNAYKKYLASRPPPSMESIKRMKGEIRSLKPTVHPLFGKFENSIEKDRASIMDGIKSYRPSNTILEINRGKTVSADVMKKKRQHHGKAILKYWKQFSTATEEDNSQDARLSMEESTQDDVKESFSKVVSASKRNFTARSQRAKADNAGEFKDKEYYVSHQAPNFHYEQGMGLERSTFEHQASEAVLDLIGDDEAELVRRKSNLKWDRKKKKFTGETGKELRAKKIRTESGVWIPASYQSDLYKQWKIKSKADHEDEDSDSDAEKREDQGPAKGYRHKTKKIGGGGAAAAGNKRGGVGGSGGKKGRNGGRIGLKSKEQILKSRKLKSKKRAFQKSRQERRAGKKSKR